MTSSNRTTSGLRRLARKIVPAPIAEAIRRETLRPISMVSRESALAVWWRRVVLRKKPVLYHFEVHITDHCNLNCRGCAHFSNLCPPTFADLDAFEADMKHMSEHFSAVHQIYLLGGEPLLHPRVADFVRVGRRYFPDTNMYLMTNGTLVTRMNDEFWSALHDTGVILLCDSYPIGLPVDEINRLGVEHGVKVEWTEQREEFFKIPIDAAGGHDAAESFRACQGFNNCPIIKDGRIYPCAYIAFADVFRDKFDLDGLEVSDRDSISIGPETSDEAIMTFLTNPVPWCEHCDMHSREFYSWGRSKRSLDEWTSTSCSDDDADNPAA